MNNYPLLLSISIVFVTTTVPMKMDKNEEKTASLTMQQVHDHLRTFIEYELQEKAQESKITDQIHYFFSDTPNHLHNMATYTSFNNEREAEAAIKGLTAKKQPMLWWVTPLLHHQI